MRILMLDNEFPPLGGGTGVVNYHLLRELATYPDIAVDLVTASRSRDTYETEHFAERITLYKVPVDNRNIHHSTNRELLTYTWRGLWQCRALLGRYRYDLSFAYAGVPAGVMSYALKLIAGLPYFVSLQGPDVPGFEARYNYLYPVLAPILRVVWRDAALVTAISADHQRLAQRTLPGLSIPILYNGVDTEAFRPAAARRNPNGLHLLCVGRLIERKGQQHLLRAFAELRARCTPVPLHLTLVGTGDSEASLRRLVAELRLADSVTLTGFVSRAEMTTIYQQADVFVLASQNEGMSIALLEAMASGLPVVVTDTGGTAELVCEGINGHIVPWADVPALAAALERLIHDAVTRERMGAESLRIVQSFGWPEITRQHVALFEHIVSGRLPIEMHGTSRTSRMTGAATS
jgi:glycosyltransferase involved in cell wall biosynthesis